MFRIIETLLNWCLGNAARLGLITTLICCSVAVGKPPPIPREFRAAWVATVANIDWPSKPGLPVEEQKAEMIRLLDVAKQLKLNAIIFQVRPAADALYKSELEPWSEYLTGQMGKSPDPAYDPLAFAIEQAHARCIELHAWFNPYRARHKSSNDKPISDDHISKTRPDLVREYDDYLWLDPGEPEGVEHSLNVILDVVNRYDVDGVHLDDYFYPYPIKDDDGNRVEFPDDQSWLSRAGDKKKASDLTRDDWRRSNVDRLIEAMYARVKQAKPWVKVGISPFGIWRPGHPPSIKGFDAYAEIYADAKKWQDNGWVDYLTPQLYWKIESSGQSYPTLLDWWHEQNKMKRHLWPGNYASRLGFDGDGRWPTEELIEQIKITRDHPGATGNVFFSMKAFTLDYGGVKKQLKIANHKRALVPASPWLDEQPPADPKIDVTRSESGWTINVQRNDERTVYYAIQTNNKGLWRTSVRPATDGEFRHSVVTEAWLTPISRTGIAGKPFAIHRAAKDIR